MESERKPSLLEKYISLTFDEDPKVRKLAAENLAKIKSPAATFALLELCYDKNEEVREVARKALNLSDKKGIGLDEFLNTQQPQPPKQPIDEMVEKTVKNPEIKKKVLPKIKQIFSDVEDEQEKVATQQGLQQYLNVISKMEAEEERDIVETIGVIGKEIDEKAIEKEVEEVVEEEGEEQHIKNNDTLLGKLINVLMLTDGDVSLLEKEVKRIKKAFETELTNAERIAKRYYKNLKITKLSEIKDGMRNINTHELTIKNVTVSFYEKKKKKEVFTRLEVRDENGEEAVIYVFGKKSDLLKPGVKVKVERGVAKTLASSGETAIIIKGRGKLYIVPW
jgi:hypothetical protein